MTRTWHKHISNPPKTPWADWIEAEIKTFEGRLDVGDWGKMQVGDRIIFSTGRKKFTVSIREIRRYKTFADAFRDLGSKLMPISGSTPESVQEIYRRIFAKIGTNVDDHTVVAVGININPV